MSEFLTMTGQQADAVEAEVNHLRTENEKLAQLASQLRAALKSILVCPAKTEDIPSNKLKIIVPEYVYHEASCVLEASCKAAAYKETSDADT